MSDETAITPAAGLSCRMGARNKLLLPIGGSPMIRHMVNVYRAATGGRVVVATGPQAEKIDSALSGSGAETVFKAVFEQGQPTAVASVGFYTDVDTRKAYAVLKADAPEDIA